MSRGRESDTSRALNTWDQRWVSSLTLAASSFGFVFIYFLTFVCVLVNSDISAGSLVARAVNRDFSSVSRVANPNKLFLFSYSVFMQLSLFIFLLSITLLTLNEHFVCVCRHLRAVRTLFGNSRRLIFFNKQTNKRQILVWGEKCFGARARRIAELELMPLIAQLQRETQTFRTKFR